MVLKMGSDESTRGMKTGGDEAAPLPDLERDLGVIEAITMVTRTCPSGVVVSAAERALEAIKKDGADTMKDQVYFVLTAMKGWRGDRAIQIHRSLSKYLSQNSAKSANDSA